MADRHVLPDNAQSYYRETIWRLPNTYVAVEGFEVGTPTLTRADFDISDDAIIYMTVQAAEKRHPDTIRLQMQVLAGVPNSYLLVKGRGNQARIKDLFLTIAAEYQLSPDRLRFLGNAPSEEVHRANLAIADIVLDTFPYNGATTTLEALWLNLPVVTKVGQQFSARNGYTFLRNLGITAGIAWTDADYIDWGIRLGLDEAYRHTLVQQLHQAKAVSPLWNAQQFARDMEHAYQQMWLNWVNLAQHN
jgi:predicted O-linked N-acetylglucosamine transferase (SPINDLY family)